MNKKIIKTFAWITCGLGITSPIAFINTSCSCSCSNHDLFPSTLSFDSTAEENLISRFIEQLTAFTTELDLSDHLTFDIDKFNPKDYTPQFSIDGSLPSGLNIDPNTGIISGTPTKVESSTFKVKATCNFKGKEISTISDEITYIISAVPTSLIYDDTAKTFFDNADKEIYATFAFQTDFNLSEHISFDIKKFDPKKYNLKFSTEGALPGGLNINPNTGIISGTPTNAGTFIFKIKATCNFNGRTISNTSRDIIYKIKAAPTLLIFDSTAEANLTNKNIYQFDGSFTTGLNLSNHINFDITELNPKEYNLQFSIDSGMLPDGLVINSTTGIISGTPTKVGTSTFYVKATCNFNGRVISKTSKQLTYQINPIPSKLSFDSEAQANLINRTINQFDESFTTGLDLSNHINFDISGFNPKECNLTFSIIEGTLPVGLAINSGTGIISGTPSNAGTSTFKIKATCNIYDKEILGTSNQITYTVNPIPSSLSYDSTAQANFIDRTINEFDESFTTGLNLSDHITTDVGGFSPKDHNLQFSINGTLPDGLNIDPDTGIISGIPTLPGIHTTAYDFKIHFTCTINGKTLEGESPDITYTINFVEKALPDDVYNIDSNGVFNGWNSGLDGAKISEQYPYYNTINIPARVTGFSKDSTTYSPLFVGILKGNTNIFVLKFAGNSKITIGGSVFYKSPLKKAYIPIGLDNFYSNQWSGMSYLEELIFPESFPKLSEDHKYMPSWTFAGAPLLKSISFNKDIRIIYSNNLSNCTSLESWTFKSGTFLIENSVHNCPKLSKITYAGTDTTLNISSSGSFSGMPTNGTFIVEGSSGVTSKQLHDAFAAIYPDIFTNWTY